MKILITGVAGFIGFNVAKELIASGHTIIGIDNLDPVYDLSIKQQRLGVLTEFKNFSFYNQDITKTGLDLRTTLDAVIHLAARDLYYEDTGASYAEYLHTNVVGTANVFEWAKSLNARRFIFASTHSVYGDTKSEIYTERGIFPKPTSPHGASKLAAEKVVEFLSANYNINSLTYRLFTSYGPNMRPHTLIPHLIDRISKDKPLGLYSSPETTRDYIYIDDVVKFFVEGLNKRLTYQVINIASGKSYSIKQMAEMIAEILGKDPKNIDYGQSEKNFGKITASQVRASTARARKYLNYSAKTPIEKGLKETVDWYMRNPEILKIAAPKT